MIYNFRNFINEEVKKSKLEYFKDNEISKKFTSAIEIEMETTSIEDYFEEYTSEEVEEILSLIKNSLLKELSRSKEFSVEKNRNFIEDLFQYLIDNFEDEDYCDELLNSKKYKNKDHKFIVEIIYPQWINYFLKDNLVYLKSKFEEHLPNFYKKWNIFFKYEIDNTLDRGLEISNNTYFDNLNKLIECVEDFYQDFQKQSFWKFTQKTGIHINLGFKNPKNWNIIKGILFLDDVGENPFVFKNMEWRKNSKFTGSIKNKLSESNELLEICLNKLKNNEISEVEKILNSKLIKILYDEGYKNFGINLLNLKQNYIEFRYPGGDIEKETLIDKILYFSYIIYTMTEIDVDRKEYQKKLYLFLTKNIKPE